MKQKSQNWSLVENEFGILKTILNWELLTKTNLNVSLVLEVSLHVVCGIIYYRFKQNPTSKN
jgi:hypothetical protein